jgi:hypothetical protein
MSHPSTNITCLGPTTMNNGFQEFEHRKIPNDGIEIPLFRLVGKLFYYDFFSVN